MNTPPRELVINTAFGPSAAAVKILACQADEWEEDEGHQRSFVLELRGDRAVIVETLDKPVYASWRSANGTAYCTSNEGELWVYGNGGWSRERVAAERVRLDKIFGWSGASPGDDRLIVTSLAAVHTRDADGWHTHPLPEQIELINGLHGLSPDEVYFATDYGLWLWHSGALGPVEGPMEDLHSVWVLSDDEMYATGDAVHRWTKAEDWTVLDSELEPTIAIAMRGDELLIGTMSGVARVQGETLTLETEEGYCNLLVELGDELLARGFVQLVYTRGCWTAFSLPALAYQEKP